MPSSASRRSLAQLGEFGLIKRLHRRFGRIGPSVLRGIGDDTAIVRAPAGRPLLLTTDLLAEGIHFDLSTATFEDIGYKAAVANLSDIAAMGGSPRHLLVAVAIPPTRTPEEIDRLYRGLMQACRRHGAELVGGDTSASRFGLFVSITLTGIIEAGRPLTRNGARAGDLVYVTGTLGDSLAGLALLTSPRRPRCAVHAGAAARHRRFLIHRHLRPSPRIPEGRFLAAHRLATAAIDLSDGLSGDLAHVCEQSGVGAELEATELPLSPACRAYASAKGMDPVRLALAGGEDYELLFTVAPRNRAKLDRLARRAGYRFTRVGSIRPRGFGLRVRLGNGTSRRLTIASYDHFRRARAAPEEALWSR